MSTDTTQSVLRKMDSDLELHHRTWEIDGDLYRCRHCMSGQLASKGSEKFVHASDCVAKNTVSDHPWLDLVRHTSALAKPVTRSRSRSCELEVGREGHASENGAECHNEQAGQRLCLHNGLKEETHV